VPDSGTDSIANGGSHCGADGSTYRFAHTCADVRACGLRHRGLVSLLELFITVR
jgi:hypothetical protein